MSTAPEILPFEVEGSDEFEIRVRGCLKILQITPSGAHAVRGILESQHRVTVLPTADGNGYCQAADIEKACTPGAGCSSTIAWNPDLDQVVPSNCPGALVVFCNLLVHAYHNALGTRPCGRPFVYPGQQGTVCLEDERLALGLAGSFVGGPEGGLVHVSDCKAAFPSENSFRADMGIERRTTFYPLNWPGGPPW